MKFLTNLWNRLVAVIKARIGIKAAVASTTPAAPVEATPVAKPDVAAPVATPAAPQMIVSESITDKLFPHAPIVPSNPQPVVDTSNDTGPYGSSFSFSAIDGRGFRNSYKAGVKTPHTVVAPRNGEMALDFAECPGVVKGGQLDLQVEDGEVVTAVPFTTDSQVRFTAEKGKTYTVYATYSVNGKFDVSLKN